MRRWPRATVLVLCLMMLRSLPAAADAFTDFRIPDHSWRRLALDLSARGSRSDASSTTRQADSEAFQGSGNMAIGWAHDAESARRSLDLGVQLYESNNDRTATQTSFSPGVLGSIRRTDDRSRDAARSGAQWLYVNGALSQHPGGGAWGFGLSTSGSLGVSQARTRADLQRDQRDSLSWSTERSRSEHDRSTYEVLLTTEAMVAFGRVRHTTPVFTARLLAERLQADGRMLREPSAAGQQKLAQVLYMASDFGAPHDRPAKFLWREIERILRQDGTLPPSGFDAFELLHVLEPLVVASGRFQRSTGWALGPVVRYRHDHSEVRDWERSSGEYELRDSLIYSYPTVDSYHRGSESDDAALAGARLEWHRPMGLRSQVDLEAEAFFDVRGPEHETNSSARLSLGHLVGERWFAFAEVRHLRELTDLYSQKWSRWEVASTAGLRYYLEDRWDIGVQCSHYQYHDDHPSSAHLRYFNRSGGIDLSIGFNRGALDAPGLIDPVRPLN